MVVSLITGIRISAEGLNNRVAQSLAPYLPQGELWSWHIIAGLVLTFSALSYIVYLRRAVLGERNGLKRLQTIAPPTTNRLRWRAINVALHWFAYGAIAGLTITGIALYIGYASLFLVLHNALAWSMLVYIAIHTIAPSGRSMG